MKRNFTKTTILLSIAILFLGFFIYNKYISPLYINSNQHSIEVDLSKESTVVLKNDTNQKEVFALEIEILGECDNNLTISCKNTEGQIMNEIKLKKGKIDFFYQNEWYNDSCTLTFSSKVNEQMKGKLKINYRFLIVN